MQFPASITIAGCATPSIKSDLKSSVRLGAADGSAAEGAFIGAARLAGLLGAALPTTAAAQVMLNVSDAAGLVAAITTVDNNPGTHYQINITQNITLSAATTLPAIDTASPLIINGGNFTIDGGGVQRGFFVYSGTVALNNLAITNALAAGGNGGAVLPSIFGAEVPAAAVWVPAEPCSLPRAPASA